MKYLIFIPLLLLLCSCSKETDIKPADIKYGQDVCTACSMIISEPNYSAQYILENGKVKKFDDIGCMVSHLKQTKNEIENVSAIFVRDYDTNNWINAISAHFLHNDQIITPMGHGIIAFAKGEDLKKVQSEKGGDNMGKLLDLINQ